MEISVRSDTALYVEIGDWTYYIDDSTGEQMMDKWRTPPHTRPGGGTRRGEPWSGETASIQREGQQGGT